MESFSWPGAKVFHLQVLDCQELCTLAKVATNKTMTHLSILLLDWWLIFRLVQDSMFIDGSPDCENFLSLQLATLADYGCVSQHCLLGINDIIALVMLAWSTTFSNAHKISKNGPAKTVSMYSIHLLGFEFGITNLFLYSQVFDICRWLDESASDISWISIMFSVDWHLTVRTKERSNPFPIWN